LEEGGGGNDGSGSDGHVGSGVSGFGSGVAEEGSGDFINGISYFVYWFSDGSSSLNDNEFGTFSGDFIISWLFGTDGGGDTLSSTSFVSFDFGLISISDGTTAVGSGTYECLSISAGFTRDLGGCFSFISGDG